MCVGNPSLDLVDALTAKLDEVSHRGQIHADHIADRFAHVQCIQHGESPAVLPYQVREAVHNRHALTGLQARPATAPETGAGRRHRTVDIPGIACAYGSEHLAIRGIDRFDNARRTVDELAADKQSRRRFGRDLRGGSLPIRFAQSAQLRKIHSAPPPAAPRRPVSSTVYLIPGA